MKPISAPETGFYLDSHGGVFKAVGNKVFVFNFRKGDFVESDRTLLELDTGARPVEEGEALDAIDRARAAAPVSSGS